MARIPIVRYKEGGKMWVFGEVIRITLGLNEVTWAQPL
jgi:hypothetical protein